MLPLAAMAGEGEKLSGLSKIFNGNTMAGRANVSRIIRLRCRGTHEVLNPNVMTLDYLQVAKATYAVVGLLIAYNVMKPKKK